MNNSVVIKDQVEDYNVKHIECFQELNQYLQKLSQKLSKDVENMEAAKLEQFKEDLMKTRSQFDEMNEKRKEKAIKKAVYSHKKQLEKQCSNFLQKSIEVNKIYEGLKQKLVNMASSESQLDDQIKYLHKQIKIATNKNQLLQKEYHDVQEYYQQQKTKKLQAKGSVLGQRTLNTSSFAKKSEQIEKIMNRTKKWEQNTEERLKIKIENTKELINSIVFEQSTLEEMFLLYDPQCYREDKKKLLLMENFLSQDNVKRQIYELLFKDDEE